MTPLTINVLIKLMFFVQVNIEPIVSVYSTDKNAPAELQINVPELVERRSYQSNLITSSLDDEKSKALAGFPALTGCDTMEKFKGKSKEAWTKCLQADCKI